MAGTAVVCIEMVGICTQAGAAPSGNEKDKAGGSAEIGGVSNLMEGNMKWSELRQRQGSVELSRKFIESNPEVVMKMLGKMIIARAERLYMTDSIKYEGWSPWFDLVPQGCIGRQYTAETNGIDVMFL